MQTDPVLMSLKEGYQRPNQLVFKAPVKEKKSVVVNGIDLLENVPPRTENEVCGRGDEGKGVWPEKHRDSKAAQPHGIDLPYYLI